MSLRKSKGNMYPWATHTWNPVKGKCPHNCSYCYMKRWGKQPPLHLDEKELRTDLGEGNFIFVGSGTDIWAEKVPHQWIIQAIIVCNYYGKNKYLFQSKNPMRFIPFIEKRHFYQNYEDIIFGTTIESNLLHSMSKVPDVLERARALLEVWEFGYKTMVTIEPIMDFDLDRLVDLIRVCYPRWVNIGADSGGNNLPEPAPSKIKELISALSEFTEVKQKPNLKRLLK